MGVFLHHWDFVPAHLGAVEVDRGQNPEIHALGGLAFLFQLCPRFAHGLPSSVGVCMRPSVYTVLLKVQGFTGS